MLYSVLMLLLLLHHFYLYIFLFSHKVPLFVEFYHLSQYWLLYQIVYDFRLVLWNRAPSSTKVHPTPPSSFQPPPSSIHLHPALCNTLNNIWTKILGNWAISPNLDRKIKSRQFWLKIGTHAIVEVLILILDFFKIPTRKSIFGPKNSKLTVFSENY